MALLNQLDETATADALARWLGAKLDDSTVEITDLEIPKASGMSMSTVLFRAATGSGEPLDLVARVAPAGDGLFIASDLEKEFGLLRLLGERDVIPVPRMRWLETDPAVLGSAFMVMDRVDGRVPGDDPPFTTGGWVMDLPPAARGEMWTDSLRVLADLHKFDWRAASVPEQGKLEPDGAPLARQLADWERYYEWVRDGGPGSPTIDAALEWIKQHLPDDGDFVLCWGDARLGNIIYGEDQHARAVLDWELATIADPGFDLGWYVLFIRFYSDAIGVPQPEGMPSREEVLAQYEELAGRAPTDVDFWEVFAAVRLAMIMFRIGRLMVAGGALPPDSQMATNNPSTHLLAGLLDLPAPEGESSNFVGNR